MSKWPALTIAALLAVPAQAATFQTRLGDYDPATGISTLSDLSSLPESTRFGAVWVRLDQGSFIAAQWTIDGELSKSWWEDVGTDGTPVPVLTGNEYTYSPTCAVSVATPRCTSPNLGAFLLGPQLLRINWRPPHDFDVCEPFPGFDIDCAERYSFFGAAHDLAVRADGPVRFAFSFTAPIPEPGSWALLIAGFTLTGAALRHRRQGQQRQGQQRQASSRA